MISRHHSTSPVVDDLFDRESTGFLCHTSCTIEITLKVNSKLLSIKTGVPQGSIPGPLLFIIYTNDIHTASSKFESILYADDTTLISPLCSFSFTSGTQVDGQDVSNNINTELNKNQTG